MLIVVAGCRRAPAPPSPGAGYRRPPRPARLLVVATEPADEAVGAFGLIDDTVRRGGTVRVVFATDGAGSPAEARADVRRALARATVGPEATTFLGYATGSLPAAWTVRWRATLRGHGDVDAGSVVEDIRRAIREAAPDAIAFPLPLDEASETRALGRFTLLALLAERAREPLPAMLGTLLHGHRRWVHRPRDPKEVEAPPDGCPGALYRWTALVLDPAAVYRKLHAIEEHRASPEDAKRRLRYAGTIEPFGLGATVAAPRAASSGRPGVHASASRVVVRIQVGACAIDPEGRDQLRLRYFRAGRLEERTLGAPGRALGVVAAPRGHGIRLTLARDLFRDVPGMLLEVIPHDPHHVGAVWLIRWTAA